MAKASREKGIRGELEVAAIFREHGFDVNRVPNSGGLRIKGDLYGELDGLHVEVKRAERSRLPEWLRQCEGECAGRVPVLVYRGSREPWRVVLPLAYYCGLLRGEL